MIPRGIDCTMSFAKQRGQRNSPGLISMVLFTLKLEV